MSGRYLLGIDSETGNTTIVETTNKKLAIVSPISYEMAVAAGYLKGVHRTITASDLYDTRTSPKAVWDFEAIQYPVIGIKKNFYVSSSSGADVGQVIRVSGIDENLDEQWGYAITNGINQVIVTTEVGSGTNSEFVHINSSTINVTSGQSPLSGILYVAEFAGGGPLNLPAQNNLVHDVIHRITTVFSTTDKSAGQSSKGSYFFGNTILDSQGQRYDPSDIFITTLGILPKDGYRISSDVSVYTAGNPPTKTLQFSNITAQSDLGDVRDLLTGESAFFRLDPRTLLNIYVSMDAVNSSFGLLMQVMFI